MVKYAVVSPGRCASIATHRLFRDLGFDTTHTHLYNSNFNQQIINREIVLVERKSMDIKWVCSHLYGQLVFSDQLSWVGPTSSRPAEAIIQKANQIQWPVVIPLTTVRTIYNNLQEYYEYKRSCNPKHLFYFEDIVQSKGKVISSMFGSSKEIRTIETPRVNTYDKLFKNYKMIIKWWERLANAPA